MLYIKELCCSVSIWPIYVHHYYYKKSISKIWVVGYEQCFASYGETSSYVLFLLELQVTNYKFDIEIAS